MDLDLTDFNSAIFDSGLCVDAVLKTTSTPSATIRVDFRNQYGLKNAGAIVYEGEELYCDCKSSDVSDAKQNDTITIDSIKYKITEIQPEDAGITRLLLRKTS